MPLVLPYPNKPANGDPLDATVVQANFTAIAQAIQSFDGSQIQAATIQASAMAISANPIQRGLESFVNYVYSGGVIGNLGGLGITISGGIFYINGNRLVFAGVGSQTLAASKDVYIDIDNLGNVVYQSVSNGAASPSITANSIRVGIVVTGAATISAINQGSILATAPTVGSTVLTVSDSLGNLIYNTDPYGAIFGVRSLFADQVTGATTPVAMTPLSCPVIVPSINTKLKLVLEGGAAYSGTSNGQCRLAIWDGTVGSGTELGNAIHGAVVGGGTGISGGILVQTSYDGVSGLKTYNASIKSNGTGTATLEASVYNALTNKEPCRLIIKRA